MKEKQLSLIQPAPKQFGGSLLKGNPKVKRPLGLKKPMHLVLKSKNAFGDNSMLAKLHVKKIASIVRKQAKLNGVKIYHFVNVGNHLHLVVQLQNRELYRVFIRAITGLIARQVLGKQRGAKVSAVTRKSRTNEKDIKAEKVQFWLARPFSRIVTWGRDFKTLGQYMQKNQAQAASRAALHHTLNTDLNATTESVGQNWGIDSQLFFMSTA